MKKVIKKMLFPNIISGFLIFNLGFGLLIYVFSNHLEESPLAYISYILSFYALIIFCVWFYKVCKFTNDSIKKSRVYHFYQKHHMIFIKVTIFSSLIFNLIYGILKLVIGVYYGSLWFITFAVYYLLLGFMKLCLVKNINNHEKEYKKLKHTGIIMLFINLILAGIIILIIKHDKIINYNGFLIYLVALCDFYFIISAIINVIKHRNNNSPVIVASKCINLTVAMVSMISLEVSMIYQFGNNDSGFKMIMTSSMGFTICLINFFMAIYMIVKANKNLK